MASNDLSFPLRYLGDHHEGRTAMDSLNKQNEQVNPVLNITRIMHYRNHLIST